MRRRGRAPSPERSLVVGTGVNGGEHRKGRRVESRWDGDNEEEGSEGAGSTRRSQKGNGNKDHCHGRADVPWCRRVSQRAVAAHSYHDGRGSRGVQVAPCSYPGHPCVGAP